LVCPECSRQAPRFKPSATEELDETGWGSVAGETSGNAGNERERFQRPAQIVLVVVLVLDFRYEGKSGFGFEKTVIDRTNRLTTRAKRSRTRTTTRTRTIGEAEDGN
jgi:hypothetical protein